MRVELRDEQRRRIGTAEVDLAQRPTRIALDGAAPMRCHGRNANPASPVDSASQREAFLTWDSAVDDAGHLRRCVACGCTDMFREKAFPQVTVFVVVLAFIGAILGVLGFATNLPVLLAMAGVLALDVAILFFSKPRLVCYRCRSTYSRLPIARYHRPWDRARADRHPAPASPAVAAAGAASAHDVPDASPPPAAAPSQFPVGKFASAERLSHSTGSRIKHGKGFLA